MRNLILSLSLVLVGFTAAAHADSFSFTGTTKSGSSGTGSITTDSSGGINGGQIVLAGGDGPIGTFNFVSATTNGIPYTGAVLSNPSANLTLYFSHSLFQSTFDTLCVGNACQFPSYSFGPTGLTATTGTVQSNAGSSDPFLSGSVSLTSISAVTPIVTPTVPSAATPEPSSLILLGTGILGMAGAARRKFLRA